MQIFLLTNSNCEISVIVNSSLFKNKKKKICFNQKSNISFFYNKIIYI